MENQVSIDPNVLITVLQNKLAQSAIREAEMEAVIQGLMAQNQELQDNPLVEVSEDVTGTDD